MPRNYGLTAAAISRKILSTKILNAPVTGKTLFLPLRKKNNYSFKIQNIMGKGDQKTKRGKIIRGSYGKTRPRKPGKTVEELIAEAPAKKEAAEKARKAREAARKEAVAARTKQKKEAAAAEAKEKKEAAKAETAAEEKKETKTKEAKPETEAAAKSEEAKASKKEAEPKEKEASSKS
jgi:30S ribosomal protein S31